MMLIADRELEALRLARSHQEQALQHTRAQLMSRETGDGDGRAHTGTSQVRQHLVFTCVSESQNILVIIFHIS